MKKIKLIIGSTRQGRVGEHIANWFVKTAKENGVEVEVLDLKEINLPRFDAAVSPAYAPTETPEGKAWQAKIVEADAIIFVTPEYNRSIPASLKDAIDYLVDWKDKQAVIVSYGWIDGGQSAVSHLKDVLSWLKMDIVEPTISVKLTQESFGENGLKEETFAEAKASFLEALDSIK